MSIDDGTDGQALFQSQRQTEITELTEQRGRVEVSDLAARYRVTTETIRRDLSELQEQRLVRRVHGGAIPWESSAFEPLLSVRNDQQNLEKRRIAKLALNELPENGTIILDSGSTLNQFAEVIPSNIRLRLVTNSLVSASLLADNASVDVIVIGGKVRKNTMAMVDASAIASIEPLTVDTLFISSDGASPEAGLTTPYREEAALKTAMISAAIRVVALVDHTKFAKDHFVRFAEWSDVDVLITTTGIDPRTVSAIESLGTTVLVA